MMMEGLDAFEASQVNSDGSSKDLAETTAGRKALQKLIKPAAAAIMKGQKAMITRRSTQQRIKAACVTVPNDVAAMLTLKELFNRVYQEADQRQGKNYQHLCVYVAEVIETELNFRFWIADSKARATEYAKENGLQKAPKAYALRMVEEATKQGITPARGLRKWAGFIDALNEYKWTKAEKHYIGEFFVTHVVEALPEVFEVHNPWIVSRPMKHIRLKEDYLSVVINNHSAIAASQSVKRPMLARPERWGQVEIALD
jgi:hypothetical protein